MPPTWNTGQDADPRLRLIVRKSHLLQLDHLKSTLLPNCRGVRSEGHYFSSRSCGLLQSRIDLCLIETDYHASIDYQNWSGHIAELS